MGEGRRDVATFAPFTRSLCIYPLTIIINRAFVVHMNIFLGA